MCEICGKEVTTYVKTEFHISIWLFSFIILYFYELIFGIPIMIIILPLLRNVTHSCPYCLEILLVNKYYPIQIKDKVKYKT